MMDARWQKKLTESSG